MEYVKKIRTILFVCSFLLPLLGVAQSKVIDEVVWIVGDEVILKSEIEENILLAKEERWEGNLYCIISEQIALRKLFIHQAKTDSIMPSTAELSAAVEQELNNAIARAGSKEKLEEYQGKSISQIREIFRTLLNDRLIEREVRAALTKNINVTPADVRRFFKSYPEEDIPYIPTQVEVQILTVQPKISQEEIERIKTELREYADRVNKGESSFSSLARLYSEDGSARFGGELEYMGRGELETPFATVAFSLQDTKKVSSVVETVYGFHIIQLIDKLGDKVKVRHILRKPTVDEATLSNMVLRLDSLANDIRNQLFTFEAAVAEISDDKDTRNNNGLMVNTRDYMRTSRFYLHELPQDISKIVAKMQVGEVSNAFIMKDERTGKEVCAVVKLKNIIHGHKANITDDFQMLQNIALEAKHEEKIKEWIREKQKNTYVKVNETYRECEFQYPGWIK